MHSVVCIGLLQLVWGGGGGGGGHAGLNSNGCLFTWGAYSCIYGAALALINSYYSWSTYVHGLYGCLFS